MMGRYHSAFLSWCFLYHIHIINYFHLPVYFDQFSYFSFQSSTFPSIFSLYSIHFSVSLLHLFSYLFFLFLFLFIFFFYFPLLFFILFSQCFSLLLSHLSTLITSLHIHNIAWPSGHSISMKLCYEDCPEESWWTYPTVSAHRNLFSTPNTSPVPHPALLSSLPPPTSHSFSPLKPPLTCSSLHPIPSHVPSGQTRAEILAVTLSGNRMAPDVNFTMIAASLEGYTGSDIKEVRSQLVARDRGPLDSYWGDEGYVYIWRAS